MIEALRVEGFISLFGTFISLRAGGVPVSRSQAAGGAEILFVGFFSFPKQRGTA